MRRCVLFIAIMLLSLNCYAQDIVLDGDSSDWIDKPSITADDESGQSVNDVVSVETAETEENETAETKENETAEIQVEEASNMEQLIVTEKTDNEVQKQSSQGGGPKYKISQLSWSLSEDSDILFLMMRLSHGQSVESTEITTEMITDYGSYDIKTNYDTSDGTVFTVINGTNITSNQGQCSVINKNTVFLEFAIPLSDLIENMRWGYTIKIKVHTEDDTEPKKDYIIIATASSGPITGAVVGGIIAGAGFYFSKRKKKQ